jgi:hypothetical protein
MFSKIDIEVVKNNNFKNYQKKGDDLTINISANPMEMHDFSRWSIR